MEGYLEKKGLTTKIRFLQQKMFLLCINILKKADGGYKSTKIYIILMEMLFFPNVHNI